ncbi:MAG TPA: ATP-binding protein [Geobacteraceae bacterium]
MPDEDLAEILNRVIGEEKRLKDILADEDVIPLIRGAVKAGVCRAAVTDEEGAELWSFGGRTASGLCSVLMPIHLEGEVVGALRIAGKRGDEPALRKLGELLLAAFRVILANKLKRVLTTEIHTKVVSQSYQELLETNRRLAASENSLRHLAESLEIKVEERTAELKKAHARLLQREKMASVGQLAAGVAHEINNPLGFISSNLQTMEKYVSRFLAMLDYFRAILPEGADGERRMEMAMGKWRELKLDFICSDISGLMKQSGDGVERVRKIVADLKDFSHVDSTGQFPVNLNEEIDKTLNVLAHELPDGAEIVRDYRPLPPFVCNPALICQVFLNIILNAAQARPKDLRLVIATARGEGGIRLSFADNGPGIPEEIRNRIFDPFFTTRDVGSGTGMGLTVAYDIVSGYGGAIEADSAAEGGAVFVVTLPAEVSS